MLMPRAESTAKQVQYAVGDGQRMRATRGAFAEAGKLGKKAWEKR